ncbi:MULTISPECIES: phosphotransferase [unclassified Corynebacterium]|uniref:phosphotransferase family protein n=1 Tax=unclassified Corynebacterium TaxID=2624378 RepID=UPI001EF675C8|nr:phosphotransferase [Corynebacterium sp. ACRQK]MCG7262324.1 phosphotransferase [Corynebacterium sp. ACRQL]
MQSVESTVEAATQVLATRFGGSPELSDPQDLGGSGSSTVLRCRISADPFLQERTVVIKQLPPESEGDVAAANADGNGGSGNGSNEGSSDAGEFGPDALGMLREVVAYQYTNTLAETVRPGPVLLGYDIDQRLLILSDAGDGTSFTDVLTLQDAKSRIGALRKLGRSLGKMHAATFGGAQSYSTLMSRQCQRHHISPEAIEESDINVGELIQSGVDLMISNGLTIDPVVQRYASKAAERQSKSEFLVFTPFDLAPDNVMLTDNVVLLDYEWAGFRDAAFDVACVVAGFPQDNSTPALDEPETTEFLAAWRAEAQQIWPAISDDEVFHDWVMSALIGWAFLSLIMMYYGRLSVAKHSSFVFGEESDNQEVSRSIRHMSEEQLEDLATTVEAIERYSRRRNSQDFTAIGGFARVLLKVLSQLGAFPNERDE